MSSRREKELWIGLARVKQPSNVDILGDADGAYVNVLTLATNAADFHFQVEEAIKELGLSLSKLDDVETMSHRQSKHSVHREIKDLSKEVMRTGALRFDVFQSFDLDH